MFETGRLNPKDKVIVTVANDRCDTIEEGQSNLPTQPRKLRRLLLNAGKQVHLLHISRKR